jgi:hypothetical protein
MTLKDARDMIGAIKLCAAEHDDEAAHSMEDALRAQALQAIANGDVDDPKALAELVMTTDGIEFRRWCA